MKLRVLGIFLFVGLLAYSNGLQGPFMVDDRVLLGPKLNAKSILGEFTLPASDVSLFPQEGSGQYYRPVHLASLVLFYRVFGKNYTAYHVLNLLLFVLAVFLIVQTIRTFFKNEALAFWSGLLYLAHPINGVLVNYITASAFSLEVIFMLLALRIIGDPSWIPAVAGMTLYLLALGCHESALMLPLYAAIVWWVKSGFDFKQAWEKTKLLWITFGVYVLFRLNVAPLQSASLEQYSRFGMHMGEYLASLSKVWLWYVTRLFYPDGIVLIWAADVVRAQTVAWILGGAAILGVLTAGVWHYRRRPELCVGLLWFAAGFLPLPFMCLLYPLFGLVIEPHWFIFSSIGFFLCIASLLSNLVVGADLVSVRLFGRTPAYRRGRQGPSLLAKVFGIVLVVVWVLTARLYNGVWADEKTYYRYWYQQSPGILMIPFNMGALYEQQDGYLSRRAFESYQIALQGGYGQETLYPKWAYKAMKEGKLDLAWNLFYVAYQKQPHSWQALNNLGTAAYMRKEYKQAVAIFKQAMSYNPSAIVGQNMSKALQKLQGGQGGL